MSLAVPPPFARMASKRISNIDATASTTPVPAVATHSATAAASLNLTPASIRPPPTHSLQHATLATLGPYQTHTLQPTAFSTPTPPTYKPRSTTPLPPSAFADSADDASADANQSESRNPSAADTALLDSLLSGNRRREDADRRLKLDVADRVSRWSHDVALQGERAVQQMDDSHNRRAAAVDNSRGGKPQEEEKESVTLGWTVQDASSGARLSWHRRDAPTQLSARSGAPKQSKRDKEREEAERRMRDMSLAHSPLSSPVATSYLDVLLATSGSAYIGSASAVSLSAFRDSEPLAVSEAARDMVSSSCALPTAPTQSIGSSASTPAAAAAPAIPSVTSSRAPSVGGGSPFPTASALHAEVARVKECVAAAGMYVHAGAVERALGGGRAVAGSAVRGGSGVWPAPFSGLVDDPKDKKKRASGDKKAAVKKAAKKK